MKTISQYGRLGTLGTGLAMSLLLFGGVAAESPEDSLSAEGDSSEALVGRVRLPSGEPAAGARIAVCGVGGQVVLSQGVLRAAPGQPLLETDINGEFTLTEPPPAGLMIGHDAGFAWLTAGEFVDRPEIALEAWGQVTGEVRIGRQAVPAIEAVLVTGWSTRPLDESARLEYSIRSDDGGRFVFERVPSRWFEAGYLIDTGHERTPTSLRPVKVRPGETLELTLGGSGRPVIGRFTAPKGGTAPATFKYGRRVLETAEPEPPLPPDHRQMRASEISRWQADWFRSPEGREARERFRRDLNRRTFAFKIEPDGTFRIEDVPEGRYRLQVVVEAEPVPGEPWRALAAYLGEAEVPTIPAGQSDAPLDLGDLPLEAMPTLK